MNEKKCMSCERCGGKLIDSGIDIDQDETLDFEFAVTKEQTATAALKAEIYLDIGFTPDQLYAYIKANTDVLAESQFLFAQWRKKMVEKYGVKGNFELRGTRIYIHG